MGTDKFLEKTLRQNVLMKESKYYKILLEGKTVANGLSVLRPEYLIKYIKNNLSIHNL